MKRTLFRTACLSSLTAGVIVAVPRSVESAPISDLYSTGVNDAGVALPAEAEEAHYRIVRIPDPNDPAADSLETNLPPFTLKAGFPVGPWIAEGTQSRWIAPKADQSTGSDPGTYTYQTTFNLTGFDPATAKVTGRWTSDNAGFDVVLNGTSLGITQGGNFGALSDFEITTGFVAGTNLLEFVINNAPPGVNPTGLRVEIARATAEKPGDPPAFLTQPKGQLALVGDAVSFSVELDGAQPITVQWRQDGVPVAGANALTYTVTGVTLGQAGDYTVVATNGFGTRTSEVARLRVLEPVPGLFSTGVNDSGNALDDYAVDTHFRLVTNPNGATQDALVHDSTVFPIVAGPWVANTDRSKWIAPDGDTSVAADGDYVYRATFTLPVDFNPATAVVFGNWASDNDGLDILVNSVATGIRNTVQFSALSAFEISQGWVAGSNTIDFKVNNAGAGDTGLRLDPLRVGALRGAGCQVRIAAQPQAATAFAGSPVLLKVVADGCPPLRYQWKREGQDLGGKTDATLDLGNVTSAQAGGYSVTVTDATGAGVGSTVARVIVLEPVPGLFNTGVDDSRQPLEDGVVDPHYRLIVNPHDPVSTNAVIEDSTVFPIVAGPWVANSETSKWIGPVLDPTASPGEYTYRLVFTVPVEFDPGTVRLEGNWATDNNAPDIVVNGAGTGILGSGDFTVLARFVITNRFQAGGNTIDFKVSNAGTDPNPTGLRIEGLRADGVKGAADRPVLTISRRGSDLAIAWPTAQAGFVLFSTASLGTPVWTAVNAAVVVEVDRNVVVLPAPASPAFFRLQR